MRNEQQTRKQIIDKRFADAGWKVHDRTEVIEEFAVSKSGKIEEPRASYGNSQFSDYVLLGRDGKPLAVIEAKRSSKDAESPFMRLHLEGILGLFNPEEILTLIDNAA